MKVREVLGIESLEIQKRNEPGSVAKTFPGSQQNNGGNSTMKFDIEVTDEGFELSAPDGKTYVYARLKQMLDRIEKFVVAIRADEPEQAAAAVAAGAITKGGAR